jgi:hypothetical protein
MTYSKATQIIAPIVDKLQRMLAEWTEQQHQRAIALCTMLTQDNDANMERSAKVTRANKSTVACYKELYSDRQKAARDVSSVRWLWPVALHPHQRPPSHLIKLRTFILK